MWEGGREGEGREGGGNVTHTKHNAAVNVEAVLTGNHGTPTLKTYQSLPPIVCLVVFWLAFLNTSKIVYLPFRLISL